MSFFLLSFTGGLVFIPQKHKTAARVKYNSGFFLTTNTYPDFGNERDCQAIKTRLEIFNTSPLREKSDKSVTRKWCFGFTLFVLSLSFLVCVFLCLLLNI